MKTWRFYEFGSIENLKMEEISIPEPAPKEALVKLDYASLNPADRYLIEGKYPRPGTPPFAVGRDGSGIIEKVGEGSRFKIGDRVLTLRSEIGVSREGTLAQYVTVPDESLALQPQGWTSQQCAASGVAQLTAWQALVEEGQVKQGDTVLVTGASGGVGTASVILAKALGARVVALSRSEEKRQKLLEMGADFAFDSSDPNIVKIVQKALDGGRADVVVENLAGPFLQKSIDMTGNHGRICVVGLLAGLTSELIIGKFIFKRIKIIGIAIGNWSSETVQYAWSDLVQKLNAANRRPQIDKIFPFEQVQEAFAHLKSGAMGKVLIGPMNG